MLAPHKHNDSLLRKQTYIQEYPRTNNPLKCLPLGITISVVTAIK